MCVKRWQNLQSTLGKILKFYLIPGVKVLCKRKVSTEFLVIRPKQLQKLRLHYI